MKTNLTYQFLNHAPTGKREKKGQWRDALMHKKKDSNKFDFYHHYYLISCTCTDGEA